MPASLVECCTPLAESTLSAEQAFDLERLFKSLADRHRVRIVNLLASAEDAICVCELERALELAQPTVSYHLKVLVAAGLLEREQRGRFAFYRIPEGALERIGALVLRSGAEALAS